MASQSKKLASGPQVPHRQPPFAKRPSGQKKAIGRNRQRTDFAGFLAKGEQSIAAGLLPEVTPFPSAQVGLARAVCLAVEQVEREAEIVSIERLFSEVHVRGVSALAGRKFLDFRLLAQLGFAGLSFNRL